MDKYHYLIVGSGLFGATFAFFARKAGKKCLVIDKRPHLGGNVYCESIEGINVHKYGAHIFHTSNREVWDCVNGIVPFNRYTNSPVANYKGKLYNLPFNMNTFYQMWGVTTPDEARAKIEEQKEEAMLALQGRTPANLEEQALSLVGRDIYEALIKGYTEKQGGAWNDQPLSSEGCRCVAFVTITISTTAIKVSLLAAITSLLTACLKALRLTLIAISLPIVRS